MSRVVLFSASDERPAIYGLFDPLFPDEVRYVGQAVNPLARYYSHIHGGALLVGKWAKRLGAEGRRPTMVEIEQCGLSQLNDREAFWIRHFVRLGQCDLNVVRPFGCPRHPDHRVIERKESPRKSVVGCSVSEAEKEEILFALEVFPGSSVSDRVRLVLLTVARNPAVREVLLSHLPKAA